VSQSGAANEDKLLTSAPPQPEMQVCTLVQKPAAVKRTPKLPASTTAPVRCVFQFKHPKFAMEPEDFEQKVIENKVLLSSCMFSSSIIIGTIVAARMDCDSTINVRYTTDEWETFKDITASYCGSDKESQLDQYVFEIDMEKKSRLHFAICLHADKEYWDNNDKNNYSVVVE
jgi:hypothetical protein